MSSVKAAGAGMPSMLRINGQEINPINTPTVEAPVKTGGVPASQKPVPGPADTSAQMEQMFDAADDAAIRGQMAQQMLEGKKPRAKKQLRKTKSGQPVADHKRIEGVFPDGDPNNKQEQAFEEAALFEEKVKESDLTFKRKSGQVEVSNQVFQADIDNGNGALVAGESAREITFKPPPLLGDDEVTAVSAPTSAVTISFTPMDRGEDTVPNMESPLMTSETDLRKVLGLKKK